MNTCGRCGGIVLPLGMVSPFTGPTCGCISPLSTDATYGPCTDKTNLAAGMLPDGWLEEKQRAKETALMIEAMQKRAAQELEEQRKAERQVFGPGAEQVRSIQPAPAMGWQCPCCRTVHAPKIVACHCQSAQTMCAKTQVS